MLLPSEELHEEVHVSDDWRFVRISSPVLASQ